MTNQQKFIEVFGIDAWQQMVVFSGMASQFKEYWTSSYKGETDLIEKIRTKIDQEGDDYDENINTDVAKGLYRAVQIIDEYTEGKGYDKK